MMPLGGSGFNRMPMPGPARSGGAGSVGPISTPFQSGSNSGGTAPPNPNPSGFGGPISNPDGGGGTKMNLRAPRVASGAVGPGPGGDRYDYGGLPSLSRPGGGFSRLM